MTMARGLPMTRRGSPEAASCHVEEFRFVTKDGLIISLCYSYRFVYGFRVNWNSNSNRVWS